MTGAQPEGTIMVVEVATLFVEPAEEDAFIAGFTQGVEILRRQPGVSNIRWGRRVEPELAYVLTAEWNEIQDHFNFRLTEDYKVFGTKFRDHLARAPEVVHFEPRG